MMKPMQLTTKLLLIFSLLLLTGCGFHLRGHEPLPPALRVLYVQSNDPYGAFTKQLSQTLTAVGVTVTETSDTAPVALQILSEQSGQQLTSQGSSGQMSTYLLTYTVTYQLLDEHGRIIQAPQSVMATRAYSAAANQILGDLNVQSGLQTEMQRDAIVQILGRLRSHVTQQTLSNAGIMPQASPLSGNKNATAP